MKSKTSFQKWIFILVVITLMSVSAMPDDVQGIWQEGVYQVDTISLADEVKATWIVVAHTADKPNHHSLDAKGLLGHFLKQPKEQQRQGIFVYSKSYAIPDTPEEQQGMTKYLLKRNRNPEWRQSESALIEELRLACKKREIPLYVNLSMNLQGEWRVLNNPRRESPDRTKQRKTPNKFFP